MLDDDRLYRRTDPGLPPPPPPKKKAAKSKAKSKAGSRQSKRRKVSESGDAAPEDEVDESHEVNGTSEEKEATEAEPNPEEVDTLGGHKWECIAVTLAEYKDFLETIRRSRDPNEKALHKRLAEEVLPVIEEADEKRARKMARREKELLNLEKLARAKRSSRIAGRAEKEREEAEAEAARRKREVDLLAAKKDQLRQTEMDEARRSRMMTREQRLKEREYKRILQEEELAALSEDSKKAEEGDKRLSERRLKAEMERKKKELEALQEEEWVFDCAKCGVHGDNIVSGHIPTCSLHTSCLLPSHILSPLTHPVHYLHTLSAALTYPAFSSHPF